MNYLVKCSGMVVALLVLFSACEKDKTNETNIEGIYKGTLSGLQTKNTNGTAEIKSATSQITMTGENEIQVHCYAEGFDTTFMMNYYQHNDSAYVCYTGNNFEVMYGHMLGDGRMGGMMDDKHNGQTQWMHHMDEEHKAGDEHFGGFDMTNHSFSYTFQMNADNPSDDRHFEGIKQ